jgi:hypothetical protein
MDDAKGSFRRCIPDSSDQHRGLRRAAVAYPAGAWDVSRFRPNILIQFDGEGWTEDAWADPQLSVGSAQLIPSSVVMMQARFLVYRPGGFDVRRSEICLD